MSIKKVKWFVSQGAVNWWIPSPARINICFCFFFFYFVLFKLPFEANSLIHSSSVKGLAASRHVTETSAKGWIPSALPLLSNPSAISGIQVQMTAKDRDWVALILSHRICQMCNSDSGHHKQPNINQRNRRVKKTQTFSCSRNGLIVQGRKMHHSFVTEPVGLKPQASLPNSILPPPFICRRKTWPAGCENRLV